MSNELYSHHHIKGCWEHHLEWAPKYRYNALRKESIKEDCEAILQSIAHERDWEILELAVMPDHVHVILRTHKPENPSDILFRLKGRSAFELFRKHPNLRMRYPHGHFWSRGSFIRNIGVDIEIERNYVRRQGDIHQTSLAKWAS
jgi:putative transposase